MASDVLIVGAGPVGLLAALGLAQAGVSVTVIEAEAQLNDSPRAAVYFATSLIALEELGILDDLDRLSMRNGLFGHHVPEHDFHARISMDCLHGLTYDYQLHCGQDVLCRVALDHLERLGVQVLFEHRLAALEQTPGTVKATIETPDGPKSIQAGWLVGADGARSATRRLLGLEFEGMSWPNRFIATNVYCDFASLGYLPANFICDPVNGGVVALLDTEGLWRLTYAEDGSLPVESYRERLPERYKAFIPEGMHYEVKTSSPYTLHQRCATQLRVGRALLAGDAAHATNPCGGLGLTTGFWTAMILSDLLAAVIRGEEDETILDRYSEERRRIFWDIASPGASRNKIMMEEKDPEQRLKDIAAIQQAVDDPDVMRQLLAFPFKVIGDPLRSNSRWAGADPTPDWGIDLANRRSQLAG
jgi:2-polyprenyl-6-methoxyphenol hydroxylase-like FAD-dependent oxidoreductase